MNSARAAELLSQMPPVARDHFSRQWDEIRGTWEAEDWYDRAEATLRFYSTHKWSEEWQRWLPV